MTSALDVGASAGTTVEPEPVHGRQIALVDLLDRLLGGGVVIHGDITLAVAEVDLVHISLRALVSSVAAAQPQARPPEP